MTIRPALLAFASLCLLAAPALAQWNWKSADDWQRPTRGRTVAPADGGGLTLTPYELLADEIGRSPNATNDELNGQVVAGRTVIRKSFALDAPAADGAVLCIFADAMGKAADTDELKVTFNGRELTYDNPQVRARPYSGVFPDDHEQVAWRGTRYKSYWRGNWHEVPVPADVLRAGDNQVVIAAAKPDHRWLVYIEPSASPDRSAVSHDGGLTWDNDRLGRDGNLNGEYLVRLNLKRHPAAGWVESDVVDLWRKGPGEAVGTPGVVQSAALSCDAAAPAGSRIEWFVRLGSSPQFDAETWTAWAPAADVAGGVAHGRELADLPLRFAQWRAVLHSDDHRAAPVVRSVDLAAKLAPQPAGKLELASLKVEQPRQVVSSVDFVHAPLDTRLKLLRERYKVDALVEGAESEFDALARLARWVAAKTEVGNHKPGELLRDMPDYDAFLAMELADKVLTHGMCVHEAATFVQLATSLGYPARRSLWSHAIAEVWLNSDAKWVAFDASGGFGYQMDDGRGAGFMDLAAAWTPDGIAPVYKAYPSNMNRKRQKVADRDVQWFGRPWFVWRSNFLETSMPDEPGHGNSGFKFNGHFRYAHPMKQPLPWFDNYSSRVGDFAFSCNQAYVHLARASVDNQLQVRMDNDAANFATLQRRVDGGAWENCQAEFDWPLGKGANTLEVRVLNPWQQQALSGDEAAAARVNKLQPPIVTRIQAERK